MPFLRRAALWASRSNNWKRQGQNSYGVMSNLKVNDQIYNFRVEKVSKVDELGLIAIKFRHGGTGATAVHLEKKDSNCTFSVGFKTFPQDSTGAPHVLEHLALCGSAQYPVRDPFFKMLSRSLSTYMNAWTGADWTMYPFATQNVADYANLRNVYMDAVFAPNLTFNDFCQEGWRLGKNEKNEWEITGVVYNEMKGAFSDSESVFSTRNQQHLLPGTIYAHVSGGDPLQIPKLSHEDLLNFYRRHYSPANALFYSYGELEVALHLKFLDSFLTQRKSPSPPPPMALGDPLEGLECFREPRKVELIGSVDPLGDPARQTKLLISFLTNRTSDAQTTFNFQVLANLLLDGAGAPLHQALIDSNIGREWAPGTGYDASTAAGTFSVGLQGLAENDTDLVQKIIMETLSKVAQTGINQERVEAVLHQIELGLCYHSANFGLGLAQKVTSAWVHARCPLDDIQVNSKIKAFREAYEKGNLFERYIKDYLLDNPHCLTLIVRPSVDFIENGKRQEAEMISKMVEKLDENSVQRILERNEQLEMEQDNRKDGKELLPCLSLTDINPKIEPSPYRICHPDKTLGYYYTAHTRISAKANGLGYFRAKLPINVSDPIEISLLPLLATCLSELGVVNRPIEIFDQQVRSVCSGLNIGILNGREGHNGIRAPLSLLLSSYALPENVPKLFPLFEEALTQTNWEDIERVRTQLTGAASALTNAIANGGHSFAISLAAAGTSSRRRQAELMNGLTQARILDKLVESNDISGLAKDLKNLSGRIQSFVGQRPGEEAAFAWVSDNLKVQERLQEGSQSLLRVLGQQEEKLMNNTPPPTTNINHPVIVKVSQHFSNIPGLLSDETKPSLATNPVAIVMPFNTNFVGCVFQGNPYDLNESANLAVLARLLPPLYLHREIREKGGAYGGGSSYSTLDGLFSFYSYRDPNPLRTLATLEKLKDWLSQVVLTSQDLLEAQLALFSELDAPQDVASEGLQQFSFGFTDEERQAMRDALMRVSIESVKEIADKYLKGSMSKVVIVEDRPDILSGLSDKGFTLYRQ